MRFLSTRRRHPLAGIIVVLFALTAMGGLYSLLGPRPASADAGQSDLVKQGQQLFLVGCATCHGLAAQGVLSNGSQSNYGPSLVGVGAAAVDFQVGTGRMPAAQVDTQIPRKRPTYTDAEIQALAAYVASLGPGPAIPDAKYTDISGLSAADVSRGGAFFRTNCTACHNSVGAGGALPDGRYAPAIRGDEGRYIYEAMLTGPQQMPVFSDDVITPQDKQAIIAYINSVQSQPSYGGSALGGIGPVSEGLAAWVFGIGALVLVTVWIAAHGARAERKE
ncbi:MAG: cytochrome bc1 complex diheme cytochrome c subunit [Nocardioidaceae bacterium]